MSRDDLEELRRRSDELESSLKAFRATLKPVPPPSPPKRVGPPLWSGPWFAELLWLLGWFVLAATTSLFEIALFSWLQSWDRNQPVPPDRPPPTQPLRAIGTPVSAESDRRLVSSMHTRYH